MNLYLVHSFLIVSPAAHSYKESDSCWEKRKAINELHVMRTKSAQVLFALLSAILAIYWPKRLTAESAIYTENTFYKSLNRLNFLKKIMTKSKSNVTILGLKEKSRLYIAGEKVSLSLSCS
jgi:hypothetical protein